MNWKDYLPSVLQLNQVYWICAVNLATVGIFQAFAPAFRKPWMVQLGTLLVSFVFSVGLLGRAGLVYAFGVSVICSALATQFYDIALSALISYVRRIFGMPNSPETFDSSAPRSSTPDSVSTDKKP
jgi:hypothetical protein